MIVLHFFRLNQFLGELPPEGTPIRMEGTVRTVASDTAGITMDHAQVHCRAVYGMTVLVFMVPVGKLQRLHGKPFGGDTADEDRLDRKLRIAERVIAEYLADLGYTVRPGLVDIGEAKPVQGVLPMGVSEKIKAQLEAQGTVSDE